MASVSRQRRWQIARKAVGNRIICGRSRKDVFSHFALNITKKRWAARGADMVCRRRDRRTSYRASVSRQGGKWGTIKREVTEYESPRGKRSEFYPPAFFGGFIAVTLPGFFLPAFREALLKRGHQTNHTRVFCCSFAGGSFPPLFTFFSMIFKTWLKQAERE